MLDFLKWAALGYAATWLLASLVFYVANRVYRVEGDPPASAWRAALLGFLWPVVLVQCLWLVSRTSLSEDRPTR